MNLLAKCLLQFAAENKIMTDIIKYFEDPEIKMLMSDLCDETQSNRGNIVYIERVYSYLQNYTNYLTDLIKKSKDLEIDVVKLAKLILYDEMKGLNYAYESEYLLIFLDSMKTDQNGSMKTFFNKHVANGLKIDCFSARKAAQK